jgi:two-component system, response regulator PdtaR
MPIFPLVDSEVPATILLVEDEVLIRLGTASDLRLNGFEVIEVASGEEALAVLESGVRVDVLLTDIRLSQGIDGETLATLFRSRRPNTKIILASGTVTPNSRVGADATFIKPVDMRKLVGCIRQLLAPK